MQLSTVSHTFHNLSQPLWHGGYKQPLTSIFITYKKWPFLHKMLTRISQDQKNAKKTHYHF